MEKIRPCIYRKITVMKKILAVAASLILVVISTNAQSDKKEPPPPPPPKPKEEVKYKVVYEEQPKVSDEKIKVKEPPPPPPKPKEVVKDDVVKEEKAKPPIIIDEKLETNKPSEPPVITVKGKGADEFYKRNPTVSDISRKGNVITIKKKNGTIEKYDMNKKEEDKSFTEKYGVSPIPPPPPPKKVS